MTDGFALFSVGFFNNVYVRNLLKFFSRYFVHSTSELVGLQEVILGKQRLLPCRLNVLLQGIVLVDENTDRYYLWCDSKSNASHT